MTQPLTVLDAPAPCDRCAHVRLGIRETLCGRMDGRDGHLLPCVVALDMLTEEGAVLCRDFEPAVEAEEIMAWLAAGADPERVPATHAEAEGIVAALLDPRTQMRAWATPGVKQISGDAPVYPDGAREVHLGMPKDMLRRLYAGESGIALSLRVGEEHWIFRFRMAP